jgi:bile acid:Na+ symporter, BASS family
MMDVHPAIRLIIQGSLILFVASIGLRAQWREVIAFLSHPAALLRAFIAVNIVVPLVAVVMCRLLPIEHATRVGIVLMAVSPLAPFVGAKMINAGLDASRTVGLYVWLLLLAIIAVPCTVALLSAIFPTKGSIGVLDVAKLVFVSALLPLCVGLLVAALLPRLAGTLAKVFFIVGGLVIVLFALVVLYKAGMQVLQLLGDGSFLAIIVTVAAGLAAGHLLGGPTLADREGLAYAAATRHPGIAAMIATKNFQSREVILAVLLFLITSLIVSAMYQALVRSSVRKTAKATATL